MSAREFDDQMAYGILGNNISWRMDAGYACLDQVPLAAVAGCGLVGCEMNPTNQKVPDIRILARNRGRASVVVLDSLLTRQFLAQRRSHLADLEPSPLSKKLISHVPQKGGKKNHHYQILPS
jgi:hypothetical protein